MKKKAYQLVFRRGLRKTKSRFLSIFVIVFLGAAFFAGLRNTPITMQKSMDAYLKQHEYGDLNLISSFGFTQTDIDKIAAIEGVSRIEGAYRTDVVLKQEDLKKEVNVIAHGQTQKFYAPDIIEGRNIENDGECLIDARLEDLDLLDKTITIQNDTGELNLKVVGIIHDSRYISNIQRGTNSYTNAENEGFIIARNNDIQTLAIPSELGDLRNHENIYNEIVVGYEASQTIGYFDGQYDDVTRTVKANITDMLQNDLVKTKKEIVGRYEEELSGPLKEYEDGLEEYNRNKEEFTKTINNAKIQLLEGKIAIIENKKQLLDAQNQLNEQTATAGEEIDSLNQKIKQYQEEINAIPKVDVTLPDEPVAPDSPPQDQIEGSWDQINQEANKSLEELKDKVNVMSDDLQTKLDGIKQLINANVELTKANNELEQASLEVQKQEAALENTEIDTTRQLEEAKAQLDDAKIQIDEAQQKIKDIPDGVLYSLTKNENAGVVSYQNDTQAMDALSKVFPLMFFLVAALVSLTTMTRMVEEQRLQNGTLRALGYSKKDVMLLYIKYVLLATFFASILGIAFGTVFFTNIIYYLYTSLLYQVNAAIHIHLTPYIIPLTLFISVIITLAVTAYVIYDELNSNPAVLLRPKPPKLGKRIFLEKINVIWKRLNFNQKVTVRNMFRYKKRFFMSIAGIAGCSALIVTGFGIKNSIKQIIPLQFNEVWNFDGSVSLDDEIDSDNLTEVVNNVSAQYNVAEAMAISEKSTAITSSKHAKELNGTFRVLSERYNDLVHYYDDDLNELPLEDDGVILSKKTAELLKVKSGEEITLTIHDQPYSVTVSNICENYYGHYVYMSKTMYEDLTKETLSYNQILFRMKDNNTELEDPLATVLKEQEHVKSVQFISTASENFNTMIKSIDIVVVIIIVVAAILAFVVLYNLTNINIQERMNEIATIKVLGFYPKEVYDYVFRENILLSGIGAVLGLVFGTLLHQFVIRTVEIDATMFYRSLDLMSYVYALVLTVLFTFIINRIMRKSLDEIDMIESLKSIE